MFRPLVKQAFFHSVSPVKSAFVLTAGNARYFDAGIVAVTMLELASVVLTVPTSFLGFEGDAGTWQAFIVAVDRDDTSGDGGRRPQIVHMSCSSNTLTGFGSTRRRWSQTLLAFFVDDHVLFDRRRPLQRLPELDLTFSIKHHKSSVEKLASNVRHQIMIAF